MILSAIVDTSQIPQVVLNPIEYAQDMNGQIPPGMSPPFVVITGAGIFRIGWTYSNGVFTNPNPDPPPPPPPTLDEIYDQALLAQRVLRGLVLALNDGSLPVGQNRTGPQIKAA